MKKKLALGIVLAVAVAVFRMVAPVEAATSINGTVIAVDTVAQTLDITSSGATTHIAVATGATLIDVAWNPIRLGNVKAGDTVQANGDYSGSTFTTTWLRDLSLSRTITGTIVSFLTSNGIPTFQMNSGANIITFTGSASTQYISYDWLPISPADTLGHNVTVNGLIRNSNSIERVENMRDMNLYANYSGTIQTLQKNGTSTTIVVNGLTIGVPPTARVYSQDSYQVSINDMQAGDAVSMSGKFVPSQNYGVASIIHDSTIVRSIAGTVTGKDTVASTFTMNAGGVNYLVQVLPTTGWSDVNWGPLSLAKLNAGDIVNVSGIGRPAVGTITGTAVVHRTYAAPLTVSVVVAKNAALSDPVTLIKGLTMAKIGSFTLTAPVSEGVRFSSFAIGTGSFAANMQNMKVMINGTQFGATQTTTTPSSTYAFSGAPMVVPVGGTAVIDVYADIVSGAPTGPQGPAVSFATCTGAGQITGAVAVCTGTPVTGQNITIVGSPAVTVTNNNTLSSRQVVMGTVGVSLAKILVRDTKNVEPLRVLDVKFTVTTPTSTGPAFQNVNLYDGSGSFIAGPVILTGSAPIYTADFTLSPSQLTIPQGGNAALELRGDVAPFTLGNTNENNPNVVSFGAVTVIGKSSGMQASVQSNVGYLATLTPLRSKLALSGAVLGTDPACGAYTGGATTGRSRGSIDYISCLKFSADSAGQDVHINSLTLSFSGAALANTTSPFTVSLIDPQTQTALDGSATALCFPSGNSCFATFSFAGSPITSGQIEGAVVQINSAGFSNVAQQYDGLDLTLNASGFLNWGDGSATIGATPSGLPLSPDVSMPLLLTHVDYQ